MLSRFASSIRPYYCHQLIHTFTSTVLKFRWTLREIKPKPEYILHYCSRFTSICLCLWVGTSLVLSVSVCLQKVCDWENSGFFELKVDDRVTLEATLAQSSIVFSLKMAVNKTSSYSSCELYWLWWVSIFKLRLFPVVLTFVIVSS